MEINVFAHKTVAPIKCGGLRWVHSLFCSTLCPLWFCNHAAGEDMAGCFYYCGLLNVMFCCRTLPLPRGAVGWSAVCDGTALVHIRLLINE